MSFLVLFDLDDTLLDGVGEHFLPAYLNALSEEINSAPRELVFQELTEAVQLMEGKLFPQNTLKTVFDNSFYSGIGIPYEELCDKLEQFYVEKYTRLKKYTRPVASASSVISELFHMGCDVAIATNPLFPRTATLQRLEWAGLSAEKYPFKLISSYENFHFAKPQPAYYAEIMAQLGWQYSNVVMVGDHWERDIYPTAQLGIPSFWVQPETGNYPSHLTVKPHPASMTGSLDAVVMWVKTLMNELEPLEIKSCASKLAVLSSTPASLDAICSILSQEDTQFRPEENSWSIVEIICHLRDADREINIPRFKSILEVENLFITGIDTDSWVRERSYQMEECQTAVQDFLTYRSQLLALIHSLPEDLWDKVIRHSIFGPTKPGELMEFIAIHDQIHIKQVFENLSLMKK